MKQICTENFIEKANKIHNYRYNYSKVKYINNREKVCIICPEHGEFWQGPYKHLIVQGCPKCGGAQKSNVDEFILKAKKVHGDKYDYSKVEYINNKTKVCIICPEHGEFWQDPHNHLKGKGCPECAESLIKPLKYTTEEFIQKCKENHIIKYDYSKTEYKGMDYKVCITCPEHGEFWQSAYLHFNGSDCPKCENAVNGFKKRKSTEEFIERSKKVHGDKYNYSKTNYITAKEKVCIICPKHGEFWQSPWHHMKGNGCPKCVSPTSKAEREICEYVKSIVGEDNVISNDRIILKGKEIDIYVPSLKIGIEYNGLYWHTKDKKYHIEKTEGCKKQGIKLIQIFEDEYVNNKDIVLSKIAHILGKCENLDKIMARKCEIREVTTEIAKPFLEKNHIQGFGSGTIYLGAYYNDILMGIMAFKKEKDSWELTRFASNNQYVCQGIGGKLFKYFVTHYNPIEIKSFADRRWTVNEENNLYIKLGFKFDGYVEPDYKYYNPEDGCKRQHKFGFRKARLNKKYGLPLTMTESEMTEKLGYIKVYDAGLIRYVWKKKY